MTTITNPGWYKKIQFNKRGFLREDKPVHRTCMLPYCKVLAQVRAINTRQLKLMVWYCVAHAQERGMPIG